MKKCHYFCSRKEISEMDFRTIIEVKGAMPTINHDEGIVMLGSCFVDNIGQRLERALFGVTVNPFGTLYNPLSIAAALRRLMEGRAFVAEELTEYRGMWHSFAHHSHFSSIDKDIALKKINDTFLRACLALQSARHLIVTFGTAYVFCLKDGTIVANCHKLPADFFVRRLMSVEEIVAHWQPLISELKTFSTSLDVTFTISPIRHLADGAHGNNVSKATLLLAVERLLEETGCHYFPAYEIVLDDLRDYRFYAADMTHPSEQAVDYIMERFAEAAFTADTIAIAHRCEKLYRRMTHRPLTDDIQSLRCFRESTATLAQQLIADYPHISPLIEKLKLK